VSDTGVDNAKHITDGTCDSHCRDSTARRLRPLNQPMARAVIAAGSLANAICKGLFAYSK
jgi:hypothetical protein